MTVAETHGKISGTGSNLSDRMEDLLTSDLFGCLRYVPPERALLPFLSAARSFRGNAIQLPNEVTRLHTAFWPWLNLRGRSPCEPDVVLGLEGKDGALHVVAIEAKYRSGISSDEDEETDPGNQLARELDTLMGVTAASFGWRRELHVESRKLVFVTADMLMPRADIADAIGEYERKRSTEADIFWTSWRFLPAILEKGLTDETDPRRVAVLEDMLALLLRKGLTMFRGVEPVQERLDLSKFEFYRSGSRQYRWPAIPRPTGSVREFNYAGGGNDA